MPKRLKPLDVKKALFESAREIIEGVLRLSSRYYHADRVPRSVWGKYPYVCWTESDFRTLIVHKMLEKLEDEVYIHTEFRIAMGKFKYDKDYARKWDKAVHEIREKLGTLRPGDIDIIVAKTDKDGPPFLLMAEVKYYHYKPRRDPLEQLKRQYKVLKILKDKGLTSKIAIVIGDLYHPNHDPQTAFRIESLSKRYKETWLYLPLKFG